MSESDDDNLLVEALENVEKSEGQESSVFSTVPDSEIFWNLKEKENCSKSEDEGLVSASGTEECNFHSKLMKSLLNNRNICGQASHSSFTSLSNDIFSHCGKKMVKRKSTDNAYEPSEFGLVSSKITRTSPELLPKLPPQETEIPSEKFMQTCFFDGNPMSSQYMANELHTNLSLVTDTPFSSVSRKRKFPGPAGLLPHWGHQTSIKSSINQRKNENSDFEKSKANSQDFTSGPWKQMLFDLAQTESSSRQLLQENNIRWMLRRAILRGPASIRKIAFIVVMIQSIDLSHTDAPTVFQDETGEMNGTISKEVLEHYSDYISNGTVLILRDVTILSPASFQSGMRVIGQFKKHYLNITLNSVVSIYSVDDEERVRKIEVIKVTKELIKSFSDPEGRREREVVENEENVDSDDETLFSNFGLMKECTPSVTNVCSSVSYKIPLSVCVKSPAVTRSTLVTVSRGSPQVLNFPKISKPTHQYSTTYSSLSLRKFVSSGVKQFEGKPLNVNFPTHSEALSRQYQSMNDGSFSAGNMTSKVIPVSSKATLDSFADDDELDTILAGIDTDAF